MTQYFAIIHSIKSITSSKYLEYMLKQSIVFYGHVHNG